MAGETAEDYAREALRRRDTPEGDPFHSGVHAEEIIGILADVRAAGSWKRYVGAWRIQLLLLQRLCAAGRASPLSTPSRQNVWVWGQSIEELEATSGCKVTPRRNYEDASGTEWRTTKHLMTHLVDLPPPLVGKVASYWRTARDPLY